MMVPQSVGAGEKNAKSYGEHVTFADRVEYKLKKGRVSVFREFRLQAK